VAAYTSHTEKEILKSCLHGREKFHFDGCPFIWKKFAKNGYLTAYAEDATAISTFNYLKKGFKKPPTNYYGLTLATGFEKYISRHALINTKLCYGPRLAFSVLLRYMKQITDLCRKHDSRYYLSVWATSMSHDYAHYPTLGDDHLANYLRYKTHLKKRFKKLKMKNKPKTESLLFLY